VINLAGQFPGNVKRQLDRIEARLDDTSPQVQTVPRAGGTNRREDGTRRCDMTPTLAVCVYCSQKIEDKEKSVSVPHLPSGVAHLACAQKVTVRTKSS